MGCFQFSRALSLPKNPQTAKQKTQNKQLILLEIPLTRTVKSTVLVSLHILEVNQTVWDLENESPSASSAPPCTLHFGLTGFEGIKQVVSDLMSRALSLQCSWSISAVVFPLIKSTVSDCSDKKGAPDVTWRPSRSRFCCAFQSVMLKRLQPGLRFSILTSWLKVPLEMSQCCWQH